MPQTTTPPTSSGDRHRVVIIGSGFGGLFAARALKHADVDVTLIARTTHHLFQPLLYQVATGILSEGEIAPATREILARQRNARVAARRRHRHRPRRADRHLRRSSAATTVTPYDTLIVAAGAGQSYFGNDQFAAVRAGHEVASTTPSSCAAASSAPSSWPSWRRTAAQAEIDRLMTFVVVGAGPTGVEMAGQIAELARRTLHARLPPHRPARRAVILLDAAPTGAAARSATSSGQGRQAARARSGSTSSSAPWSTDVDATGIEVKDADGTDAPDRVGREGLGRRRAGQPARRPARRAVRRRDRPRRPGRGQRPTSPCPATPRSSSSAT